MKWLGIASGVVTLLLAVPAILGLRWWLRGALCLAVVITIIAIFSYLRPEPYDLEFLDHRIDLDFQDPLAKKVIQIRRTRMRALRNGVETVTDHMSADGGMSIPEVTPGILKQITREGGDLYVESTLGHVLRKGEEVEREMTFTLEGSFLNSSNEYWNVRIHHPTTRFTLTVKFMNEKAPKNIRGVQRTSTYEKLTNVQPRIDFMGGRPVLTWSVNSPALRDLYRVDWSW